jgi:serine/threonine protein kinase
MRADLIGERLSGRYRMNGLIAVGGMGEVWSATDEQLGRDVAIKVMHVEAAADPVFVQRFQEEARLAARLSHPTIVTVHDSGEDDGLAYLVMEYVPGQTLAQAVRDEGALPVPRVRLILAQAAVALSVAHAAGIVHRDVKPGNVLLTADGGVKLTDFGIARAAEGTGLTRVGEVLGTPQYLSPEQMTGQPATERSDLYALGVIGHEMLTGAKPFDGAGPVVIALAHLNDPIPPLPDHVPPALAELIRACLAKDPADRPDSAAWLADRLARLELPTGPYAAPAPPLAAEPADLPTAPATVEPPAVEHPALEHAAHEHPGLDPIPPRGSPVLWAAVVGLVVVLMVLAVAFVGR